MNHGPYPLAEDAVPRDRRLSVVVRGPGGRFRLTAGLVVVVCGVLAVIAANGTGYTFSPAPREVTLPEIEAPASAAASKKLLAKLTTQKKQLAAGLQRLSPSGTYIVVDQTQNRLYLMNDDAIVRAAVCSAGSGMVLKASGSEKKWVFDTPRGVYKVRNKITNPIWKKPDWAFVEEGKPLPKNPEDRFESGTLGKYALYLEDGYMIHGTLYTRLLGRSVTHGCIRLGPDDLQAVWDAAPIGTPVYIF